MICGLCRGSGSLLATLRGLQWWTCPACGGAGAQAMSGPPTFTQARRGLAVRAILQGEKS